MRAAKVFLIVSIVALLFVGFNYRSASVAFSELYRTVVCYLRGQIPLARSTTSEERVEPPPAEPWERVLSLVKEATSWDPRSRDHQAALTLLDEAEKLDPQNALVDYARALALLKAPGQSVWKEKALAEAEAGNRKPYLDHSPAKWADKVYEHALKEKKLPRYFASMEAANSPVDLLWVNSGLRALARQASYAAEDRLYAGRPEETIRLAKLNAGIADKLYSKPGGTPIDMMVGLAIDDLGRTFAGPAAYEINDREELDRLSVRGLAYGLYIDKVRAALGQITPYLPLYPVIIHFMIGLGILAVAYLLWGLLGLLLSRRRVTQPRACSGARFPLRLWLLVAFIAPILSVIAFVVIKSLTYDYPLEGAFDRGMLFNAVGMLSYSTLEKASAFIWLAAAGVWVVSLWLLSPLMGRGYVSSRTGSRPKLLTLYNPFCRREESRALRAGLQASALPGALALVLVLLFLTWPAARVIEGASYQTLNREKLLMEKVGRPTPLERDRVQAEIEKLSAQLSSDDDEEARTAARGLLRAFATDKFPEIVRVFFKHRGDENWSGLLWDITRIPGGVPLELILPHLLTEQSEPDWDAASLLATSDDPRATEAINRLREMVSPKATGPAPAPGADVLSIFLSKLAAKVKEEASSEEAQGLISALAQGGHCDFAMELIRCLYAAGGTMRFQRTLAIIGTEEARAIYREHYRQFGFMTDYPGLVDETLAADLLREAIAEKSEVSVPEIIAAFATPRLEPLFLEGLAPEQHAETRAFCAYMLGYAGDESVVPALIEALSGAEATEAESTSDQAGYEERWVIRANAAYALGRIRSPMARPALEKALQDANEEVKEAARWALDQIRSGG